MTRDESQYLEPASHAVTRKNGERGSGNGRDRSLDSVRVDSVKRLTISSSVTPQHAGRW